MGIPKTAMYITKFTVEGKLPFPIDMLRYDSCFPSTEEESFKITNKEAATALKVTTEKRGSKTILTMRWREQEAVTIQLTRICPNSSPPTVDRWKSFGWAVVPVPIELGHRRENGE